MRAQNDMPKNGRSKQILIALIQLSNMTDWFGWSGRILRVNLTKGKTKKHLLSKKLALEFIGGRGFNSKILYDETGLKTSALSPENRLIFGAGPLVGTMGPGAGRFTISAKSPLTGILGDGNAGGNWAPELKFAGYDCIVIEGRAADPVFLWIDDDAIEILDAKDIWGKNVWETNEILQEELNDNEVKILSIGQGGENLVKLASIIVHFSRAAGRTGLGAVMGSKNLKAIAVRGTKCVKIAKPEKYLKLIREAYDEILMDQCYQSLALMGTTCLVSFCNELACLPTKNFRDNRWDDKKVEAISGEVFRRDYVYKNWACFCCPIGCGQVGVIKEGKYKGTLVPTPEYGTSFGHFGANLEIDDLPSILIYNNLLNQYGLDGKELGNTISAAMEWYERGIINKKDTGGLELEWGREDVVFELIHQVAKREGFGKILAEGAFNAAKKLGKGAEKYVVQTKGMTWSGTTSYGVVAQILGHVTATRGADHLRSLPWPVEGSGLVPIDEVVELYGTKEVAEGTSYHPAKADITIHYQNVCTLADIIGVCRFNSSWWGWAKGETEAFSKLLSTVTGVDFNVKRLTLAAERVWNLERAYAVREGITRKDDVPPPRYFEPTPSGPAKGFTLDPAKFEGVKDAYYERMGWDQNGVPTTKKLKELNLRYIATDLKKRKIV